jgi:hypothetical protein
MVGRRRFHYLKYGFYFASTALLAAFPWILSWLSSPLPPSLASTATILPITRTAQIDPQVAASLVAALNFSPTPTVTPTATFTLTPTFTATVTGTSTPLPTATETPLPSLTPLPEVTIITINTVNAYTCPGSQYKKGAVERGQRFVILGWDAVEEDGQDWVWVLISDVIGQAQVWIRESEYVIISHLDYKDYLPRAACRPFSNE